MAQIDIGKAEGLEALQAGQVTSGALREASVPAVDFDGEVSQVDETREGVKEAQTDFVHSEVAAAEVGAYSAQGLNQGPRS